MSITPVDKPPDGDDGAGRGMQRRSSTLLEYVERFASWLGDQLADDGPPARRQTASQPTDDAVAHESTQIEPVEAVASHSYDGVPGREQPLTYPARNSPGINSPDVVGIETDQGLTISEPENPDAELTSDVWIDVEP